MEKYFVGNHAHSLVPSGKRWKLVWHDEFDGDTLDESKWGFRRNFWGKPFETFTNEGVVLDGNSNLKLYLTERDGHFYSPQLQTGSNSFDNPKEMKDHFWPLGRIEKPKFMHKYGYYEICCKLQEQPGWWSAFWLQSPYYGTRWDPKECGVEVDIMENFERNGEVTSGIIWNGYGEMFKEGGRISFQIEETEDGYHLFGVEWSKDGYVFYADGKEPCRVDGPVSDVEQFILVSTECMGYRSSGKPSPKLKDAVLPDCFTVDFVRVFDEIDNSR